LTVPAVGARLDKAAFFREVRVFQRQKPSVMSIQFLCPYGHRLIVPDHRAGKRGRCPKCRQRVIVPVPDPVPSGREKREWNAAAKDRIELDESPPAAVQTAPPAAGAAPATFAAEPAASDSEPMVNEIVLPESLDIAEEPPHVAQGEIPAPPITAHPAAPPAPPSPPAATRSAAAMPQIPPPPPPRTPRPSTPAPPEAPLETPPVAPPATSVAPLSVEEPAEPMTAAASSAPDHGGLSPPTSRWICPADEESVQRAYRANPQQLEITYWLAVVLLFVIVFAAAPSLTYLQLDRAPPWAQIMLLIAGVQVAYTVWLIILPDWSSVWVGMWVFGVSAALYAGGMGLFAMSDQAPLGVSGSTASATAWCGAITLVLGLLSYACGQVCVNWRRADR
jgi:hypothetical protein